MQAREPERMLTRSDLCATDGSKGEQATKSRSPNARRATTRLPVGHPSSAAKRLICAARVGSFGLMVAIPPPSVSAYRPAPRLIRFLLNHTRIARPCTSPVDLPCHYPSGSEPSRLPCYDESKAGHHKARRPSVHKPVGVWEAFSTASSILSTLGKICACGPPVRCLNPVRDPRFCSIPP
jgi:hypothetical protein